MHRHPFQADALANDVPGGSRYLGHNGQLLARQPVEETRLADIRLPREDDPDTLAEQAPLPGLGQDIFQLRAHGVQLAGCLSPLRSRALHEKRVRVRRATAPAHGTRRTTEQRRDRVSSEESLRSTMVQA